MYVLLLFFGLLVHVDCALAAEARSFFFIYWRRARTGGKNRARSSGTRRFAYRIRKSSSPRLCLPFCLFSKTNITTDTPRMQFSKVVNRNAVAIRNKPFIDCRVVKKKKIEIKSSSCVSFRRWTGSAGQCTGQFLRIHLRTGPGFERLFGRQQC